MSGTSQVYLIQIPSFSVLLKSNYTGQEMTVQEKDARLYELDINEGDKVFLIEGEMRKLR